MDYKEISRKTVGHLYQAHSSIRNSGIDNKLIALVELRISQLNGCSYCCSFHANELREMGMELSLIDKIPGYKHSVSFDNRQVLVLKWADAVTGLTDDIDSLLKELKQEFSEKEIVELTSSISLMNALNRLRISLGDKY
ncbi:alkylhydroperoxidase AhpD family core domain-containing protein [Chryseobacterium oranimense]|uniref:Alkylhydroperoxidase AhpD family core domain-containing protein n=1 Tax=Chryseobacterium oranimense TaxID=421058 RepID=A0A1M5TGD2_9FLAO|nr:carboxymuconolactone decarboxylase family protein [Chryseobacterium oranimense]CEJ69968.1 Alkyl hydroperoxide reductase AhpD [Chryseobacterium oranimense G311]SHH49774.1 alkylhydroperoxidase AhpD family core domain-containing protein [Chryseobacterium oranimense]